MYSQTREALTAAGAAVLVNKVIDPSLLDYQRRFAPVIAAIPRVQWNSTIYNFNQQTYRPAGGQVVDGGARPMTNSRYEQTPFTIRSTQIIGGVTGYAAAVTAGLLPDLLGKEIESALQGHYWDLETLAMWGSSAATANGPGPQFDGFDNLVSTFSGTGTNCVDVNGALTLSVLDKMADQVNRNAAMSPFGSQYMYLMSTTAEARIAQLLQPQQQYMSVEVAAGMIVPTYKNIPLVSSSFLNGAAFSMGTCTIATATTGGTLPSSSTYKYVVTAVIARSGETLPCAEVSQATGAGTETSTITLSFTPPTGLDDAGPILYKVYRTAAAGATGSQTLIGIVDAVVTTPDNGLTRTATTSIMDTGTALVPKNSTTTPDTVPTAYAGANLLKKPPAAGQEPIYLVPRDANYLVRPYVREAARLPVSTTIAAPDTLPFAVQTDTCVALRAPRYLSAALRVTTTLA